MTKVKGMLLIPWIKVIRADKTGMFEKWLDDTDREILSQRIFPSSWYPFSTYQHTFDAVSDVLAKGREKILYDWGFDASADLLTKTYRNIIIPGSPLKSMEKCMFMGDLFFDFGKIEMKVTGEKSFEIHIADFPKEFKNLYLLMRGWYARLLTIAGAKSVKSEITGKPWLGTDPHCVITYNFE